MTDKSSRSKQFVKRSPLYNRGLPLICFWGLLFTFCTACRQNPVPKPIAYPRLDYPRADYIKADTLHYPFTFEYPAYACLEIPSDKRNEGIWLNIKLDRFQATLFSSYIHGSMKDIRKRILANESHLYEQAPPYSRIRKQGFLSGDSLLEGYLYEMDGNTANPLQFILTDKRERLFRGTLYFNYIPNRDSIKDIIDGLTTDIRYMMESFKFKQ